MSCLETASAAEAAIGSLVSLCESPTSVIEPTTSATVTSKPLVTVTVTGLSTTSSQGGANASISQALVGTWPWSFALLVSLAAFFSFFI
jgi:hypothetical protein